MTAKNWQIFVKVESRKLGAGGGNEVDMTACIK